MTCANEVLRKRIEVVLEMAVSTISSLTELFKSSAPMMNEEDGLEKDAEKGPSRPLGDEPPANAELEVSEPVMESDPN